MQITLPSLYVVLPPRKYSRLPALIMNIDAKFAVRSRECFHIAACPSRIAERIWLCYWSIFYFIISIPTWTSSIRHQTNKALVYQEKMSVQ